MTNKERHTRVLSDRVIAKLKQIASQRADNEAEKEQKAQAMKAALSDGMKSYIAGIESRIAKKHSQTT